MTADRRLTTGEVARRIIEEQRETIAILEARVAVLTEALENEREGWAAERVSL